MSFIYTVYEHLAQMLAQIEPKKLLSMRADVEVQQRLNFL